MRSTFMGLEASKRGLFTQQSALYTTGHNIANANTEGYSRQRVNMSPTLPYPGTGLNAQKTPGFIGTGVEAEAVQRIRDEFIDRQYRQETNKLGYWESRTNAISQMEDILAEPSKYGLDEAFRLFWSSLEDVSATPEDSSARKVVIQRAQHLADSFNFIDTQLKQIQGNLGNEIDVSVTQVNSILKQIAGINEQIQAIEPNGYMPNDLYDKRDVLVDKLNEYLPVNTDLVKSGGNALKIAEGSLTITYKSKDGKEITLVEGNQFAKLAAFDIEDKYVDNGVDNLGNGEYNPFERLVFSNISVDPNTSSIQESIQQDQFESSKGKLMSLIDSFGYSNGDGTTEEGYYPEMLAQLDKLANVFASAFNALHLQGYTLDSTSTDSADGELFFLGESPNIGTDGKYNDIDGQGTITARTIKINTALLDNPSKVAASSKPGEEGNGKWALELANIQSRSIGSGGFTVNGIDIKWPTVASDNLEGATFQSFYQGLIGKLGVDGEESNRLKTNTETIRLTVENNRASMSSVSLDEEMTEMIRFQQAYNANARMLTVIDETLDKIINGMGRVGL